MKSSKGPIWSYKIKGKESDIDIDNVIYGALERFISYVYIYDRTSFVIYYIINNKVDGTCVGLVQDHEIDGDLYVGVMETNYIK